MSVTWARKIWEGRSGGGGIDGRLRLSQKYKVLTDNKNDESDTVLRASALPYLGQLYQGDFLAYCDNITATQDSASPTLWVVTATYTNERLGENGEQPNEDPLADPVDVSWSTEQYQRVADTDNASQGIVNSAGDPFDPPAMRDESRRVVTITSNESTVPSWVLSYQDAVNSSACTIDGFSVAAGQAKCQSVTISSAKRRNDTTYRQVSFSIHLRNEGWKLKLLDQGFRERDDDNKLQQITNEADGSEPTAPVLLDGSGKALTDPNVGSAVFLDFDVYTELDFTALPGIT